MVDIKRLKDELTDDPLAVGYASMTSQQAADSLNAQTREVVQSRLSGSTIFNTIVPGEFSALTDTKKQFVRDVFSLGDAVDVGPGTNARTVLLDAFGSGTTTRANLVAAVTKTQSRAVELGILGVSPEIGPAHIEKARA